MHGKMSRDTKHGRTEKSLHPDSPLSSPDGIFVLGALWAMVGLWEGELFLFMSGTHQGLNLGYMLVFVIMVYAVVTVGAVVVLVVGVGVVDIVLWVPSGC